MNTKVLVGLGVVGAIALYLYFRPKKPKTIENTSVPEPQKISDAVEPTIYGTIYSGGGISVTNNGTTITKKMADGSIKVRNLSEYPPEVLAQMKARATMPRKPLQ